MLSFTGLPLASVGRLALRERRDEIGETTYEVAAADAPPAVAFED